MVEKESVVKFLRELIDKFEKEILVCDIVTEEQDIGNRDNIMLGIIENKPTGSYKIELQYHDPKKKEEFVIWKVDPNVRPLLTLRKR